jgi:arylsulfatase A-like enzyme
VVIFIDDMGYGDIGPFGSTINHTPHLDRMAEEGMKLTSFYVAAPVCTPSRAALLTGCYPKRVGLARGSFHAVLFPGDKHGLHPDEITIAEVLGKVGYATGCFGKWHLGDQPQFLPTSQGFHEYFGIPYSNDMWHGHQGWHFTPLPLVRGGQAVGEVKTMEDQAQLCKRFTEEAAAFIERNKDRPFFVYLPHAFIHHPRAARQPFLDKSTNPDRVTGAQIEEVDWSVGQVLDTLRRLKLDQRTLVIFTSDNGGARGCVNRPLRGGKGSAFEGGMREPTLAWWPGRIPAASVSGELVTAMDLLPTFAHLAAARVPHDRIIDGKDVSPLLLARPGAKSPHDAFFYYRGNNLSAVRSGAWKLFADGRLYHLDWDVSETRDIAAKHPDVVARLETLLARARDDLGDGEKPGKDCRQVGIADNPRVILPRPGVEGEAAYAPVGPEHRR